MRRLLEQQRFDSLSVADVLESASVSRASFYFYFASKQDLLHALVRDAVSQGRESAEPWIGKQIEPLEALRHGVTDGARRWRANAGVLMAIVENFGSDEGLRALWLQQMDMFTDAATERILADPVASARLAGRDVRAIAAALTWMAERLYYLAVSGVAPFDDQDVLVETLTGAWVDMVYGGPANAKGDVASPPRRTGRRSRPTGSQAGASRKSGHA
jgi:AcrR family transcriptional regulator